MRQSLRPLLVFAYLLIAGVATAHAAAARLMEPEPHGKSTRLAVLLHSFTADGASMRQVTNVLLETDGWADTDTLAPDLPFGRFSITSPAEVLANLVVSIDAAWTKRLARGQPYEQIVIIGHSMGSLFARKLYAVACGEIADAPFESELKERLAAIGAAPVDAVRPWAGTVKRIVLMAGLNRGWSISHHMSLWRGLTMSAGVSLSRWVEALTGEQFIIMAAHRGAPS